MMQDVHVKLIQDCNNKNSIQQEEDSFYQQTSLKFKQKTSEVLQLKDSIVWC